jgi:hypothetical protein
LILLPLEKVAKTPFSVEPDEGYPSPDAYFVRVTLSLKERGVLHFVCELRESSFYLHLHKLDPGLRRVMS